MHWALKNFEESVGVTTSIHLRSCPQNVLLDDYSKEASLMSTERTQRNDLTPQIIQVLCDLQHDLKKEHPFNTFTKMPAFKQLITTCDSLYHEFRDEAIVTGTQATPLMTMTIGSWPELSAWLADCP